MELAKRNGSIVHKGIGSTVKIECCLDISAISGNRIVYSLGLGCRLMGMLRSCNDIRVIG